MTDRSDACVRIRVALAEQDLDDAQRRTTAAIRAVYDAEDALQTARDDLHRARAVEWRRRADLHRIRRADAA